MTKELRLERDVVFLDLEATGTDPARDRIVQVAMIRLSPDGTRRSWCTYVRPEIPIPMEAVAVHHITEEAVRGAPLFCEIAGLALEFMRDADLGGFGVIRYDLPLLSAEFKRAGVEFDLSSRRVVDALVIFHRLEPRNLTAAVSFYCGRALEGAHDALADAAAALDVVAAQIRHYQGRADRPDLPPDIRGLADFCASANPKNVDSRGKFVWRNGAAAFNFGRHQTRSLEEVVRADRSYVEWLARGEGCPPEAAEICRRALRGEFPRR